jgi:hypothetical protein
MPGAPGHFAPDPFQIESIPSLRELLRLACKDGSDLRAQRSLA